MADRGISRRQLLLCSALLAVYPVAGMAETPPSKAEPETGSDANLEHFAYLLFPHPAVPDSVYAGIVNGMTAEAAGNPDLQAAMSEAIAALGPDWLSLPENRQVEGMQALQGEAFFGLLRFRVAAALYELPVVWEVIRYDGPSLPYGGYRNKGVGTMGWLEGSEA
jgi:hypothetical protein